MKLLTSHKQHVEINKHEFTFSDGVWCTIMPPDQDEALGAWEIQFNPDDPATYYEGSFWLSNPIEERKVIDYDGLPSLPDHVITALQHLNFNTTEL